MAVSKREIVSEISSHTGLSQVDVSIIVEEFMAAVGRALVQGRIIEIRGFGKFKTKMKKSRVGRNPRTGAVVEIKEGLKPVFAASKELKRRVDEAKA